MTPFLPHWASLVVYSYVLVGLLVAIITTLAVQAADAADNDIPEPGSKLNLNDVTLKRLIGIHIVLTLTWPVILVLLCIPPEEEDIKED